MRADFQPDNMGDDLGDHYCSNCDEESNFQDVSGLCLILQVQCILDGANSILTSEFFLTTSSVDLMQIK